MPTHECPSSPDICGPPSMSRAPARVCSSCGQGRGEVAPRSRASHLGCLCADAGVASASATRQRAGAGRTPRCPEPARALGMAMDEAARCCRENAANGRPEGGPVHRPGCSPIRACRESPGQKENMCSPSASSACWIKFSACSSRCMVRHHTEGRATLTSGSCSPATHARRPLGTQMFLPGVDHVLGVGRPRVVSSLAALAF